jgi:hypothetical protein
MHLVPAAYFTIKNKLKKLIGIGPACLLWNLWGLKREYIVTKANQNEALPWKIAVLGIEKVLCWCRNLLSLAHTGILHANIGKFHNNY